MNGAAMTACGKSFQWTRTNHALL